MWGLWNNRNAAFSQKFNHRDRRVTRGCCRDGVSNCQQCLVTREQLFFLVFQEFHGNNTDKQCPWGTNSVWTIPSLSKKQMSMDFIFDFLRLAFFGRGDADVCHFLLCLFFWIVLSDPCFVTFNHILREISVPFFHSRRWRPMSFQLSFCSIARFLGTNFAHNFFMVDSSVKTWWNVVWFKFNSLVNIRTVSRRSDRTRAPTTSTLLSVMRLLSNLHVKCKPTVLPDRAIRKLSH